MHCGGLAAAHVAQSHSAYFPFALIIAEERRTCRARLQLRRPSNEINETLLRATVNKIRTLCRRTSRRSHKNASEN